MHKENNQTGRQTDRQTDRQENDTGIQTVAHKNTVNQHDTTRD